MRIARNIAELQTFLSRCERPVGLVPTMGAIHEGHLSLIARSRAESTTVITTIFVNAKQFDSIQDLSNYPRPLEEDIDLLADAGVDLLFVPREEEIYPLGFSTKVQVADLGSDRWEGAIRPGHFDGVATIVTKLLLMISADAAYFGQKDAQQLAVIKRLARDLHIPTKIIGVPTVRDNDGLAFSSRNISLSEAERSAATVVYRSLETAHARYSMGERRKAILEQVCLEALSAEPLIESIQYVGLVDPDSFIEVGTGNGFIEGSALLIVSVTIGSIKLIDNVILNGLGCPE